MSEGAAQLNGSFLGTNASLPRDRRRLREGAQQSRNRARGRCRQCAGEAQHSVPGRRVPAPATRQSSTSIVQETTDALFSQARHEPFKTLHGSFNVFKSFQASKQALVTVGCRVNDEAAPSFGTGKLIPHSHRVSTDSTYPLDELILRVGLPLRNETATAAQLKIRWAQPVSRRLPGGHGRRHADRGVAKIEVARHSGGARHILRSDRQPPVGRCAFAQPETR